MDGWTIVLLPEVSMPAAQVRTNSIAEWVRSNDLNETRVGISSRLVRFKNEEDATFFRISFL